MAHTKAAIADWTEPFEPDTADKVDGYWYGRYHGLREAIYLMTEVENHNEAV
jgi:hypothetical protein